MRGREVRGLQPAHERVLDLLVVAPPAVGRNGKPMTNFALVAEKTHWPQYVVERLVKDAREFLGFKTTAELKEHWANRRPR